MKCATLLLAMTVALPACNRPEHAEKHSQMNQWMVDTYHKDMSHAAVVSQRTVFPHHFVDQTDKLNARGERNLRILVTHFKQHPGTLNVRQADTPQALYEARLAAVRQFLASHEIPPDAVTLADGFSGGDGITSEQWREPTEEEPAQFPEAPQ